MVQTIDPTKVLVGAGNVYSRAVGVLTPWSSIGATMDDTAVRITQGWYRPELNGMMGPVQGLDYKNEELAELEFTIVEIAGSKLALAIPGATSTAGVTTAAGTPLSTTLTAAAAVGATTISLTAATNGAVGDFIAIGTAPETIEYRQITAIATLDVSFRDPLQYVHAIGAAVTETIDDGKTEITGSTVRRQPDSAYNAWALVAEAPNGYYEFLLDRGISTTESAELSFGDETTGAIRTTIQSRFLGSAANTPTWRLRVPA